VARVSPTVNPATRSLTVYVRIPNADGALKGNAFATGRIVSRSIQGALVIPMQALRQAPETGQPFVYRIDGDVLDIVQVTLGVVDEIRGNAEVVEGLSPGDRIVVGNVGTLGRGIKVQVLGERGETGDERRGKQ
jgi:multidrug efflux pump subunit AcrA (membrane-fusion protein)